MESVKSINPYMSGLDASGPRFLRIRAIFRNRSLACSVNFPRDDPPPLNWLAARRRSLEIGSVSATERSFISCAKDIPSDFIPCWFKISSEYSKSVCQKFGIVIWRATHRICVNSKLLERDVKEFYFVKQSIAFAYVLCGEHSDFYSYTK
jgi:hypothetical protein